MKGYVELPNAREVRNTERAVLLEYGVGCKQQGWFPKKTIAYEGGKTFVALWFNKKTIGAVVPKKTELVNKFEKKRLIQLNLPLGDNLDCLIKAGEYVIKCYADYRKGSVNSGGVLSEALDELSHWIEVNKKDKKGE